ncbi:DUF5049 domain-containing protein [Dehalococcoides mccartyi]|uniref:DUF5049 domain-containing protein n=2 Tax=Bacillati TaxID=1783272 RepID=A0A1M6L040_9FIRM|nr:MULTISPECIES: DUF5049 domain-containing protein [Terrabacteria group]BAZ97290.1 DUF5049 domain-containing protein [Dehalococcoides mccartyi]SHJ64615.1 protein of unknown function [Hespellia stercorisuis DSM 15480]
MSEAVKEQILAIRDTGLTNMFDVRTVQHIANDRSFYELVVYLEEHRYEYAHFILTGEA